ncbi:adenosylcobinamide-phosphate synthase CbiB [Novispirillum itersonii]|uniref:Cobalamin biosynthesis protein CobD n=1 Tax=Novispirillum itersonii TaxID=189 RepID=A0A7X0DMY2_NOVIT|nr:adenosylcobinamide-phosphate synthase CbiB [Novispirillum itersonii]MBB6209672.1 adenosylcobinamide-phosphate synthase [Novispirillum itersonii]
MAFSSSETASLLSMTEPALLAGAGVAAALILDALIGDPPALYRRVPHPVVLYGHLISALEARLNRSTLSSIRRRGLGILLLLILLTISAGLGLALTWAAGHWPALHAVNALIAMTLIAQKSLYQHVVAVADALDHGGLNAGRTAVSMIVGRDVTQLDTAGVSRAAIESAAENFSDGVTAPVFWLAVAGLPGLLAYKAVNTLDSMVGHRSERYREFGWASARFDDLVNLIPARFSGLLLCLSAALIPGARAGTALRVMLRDAGKHRSPNAGWPESAMAGALGLKLAGPRLYPGYRVDDPFIGDGTAAASAADIRRALRLMVLSCLLNGIAAIILTLAVHRMTALFWGAPPT